MAETRHFSPHSSAARTRVEVREVWARPPGVRLSPEGAGDAGGREIRAIKATKQGGVLLISVMHLPFTAPTATNGHLNTYLLTPGLYHGYHRPTGEIIAGKPISCRPDLVVCVRCCSSL